MRDSQLQIIYCVITAEHRWTKMNVTYRFTPGVGYTSDLPRETVRKVFQQAFEVNDRTVIVLLLLMHCTSSDVINFTSHTLLRQSA